MLGFGEQMPIPALNENKILLRVPMYFSLNSSVFVLSFPLPPPHNLFSDFYFILFWFWNKGFQFLH